MSSDRSVRHGEPSTGLAVASLVLGILSILTLGCLGIGALTGLVLGIVALVRVNRSPEQYGGKGLAIGGIVTSVLGVLLIPVAGIIAAIAIPSLLRARLSANEAGTIGDIRTVLSAEAAYQATNGGHYDTLECLNRPGRCIPGYTGPAFLEPLAAATSNGYRRTFHPGAPTKPGADQIGKVSPSSLDSFAYTAVPAQPGQTGIRGFCGDASGVVCFTTDGSAEVVNGACGPSCKPLR